MDFQKKLYDSLPHYKKKAKQFDLMKVKIEMAEEAAEAKRQNLNMSVEEWKNKYLFPYGDIAPMPDNNKNHN
jgi:hypothetical protein